MISLIQLHAPIELKQRPCLGVSSVVRGLTLDLISRMTHTGFSFIMSPLLDRASGIWQRKFAKSRLYLNSPFFTEEEAQKEEIYKFVKKKKLRSHKRLWIFYKKNDKATKAPASYVKKKWRNQNYVHMASPKKLNWQRKQLLLCYYWLCTLKLIGHGMLVVNETYIYHGWMFGWLGSLLHFFFL